MSVSDVVHAIGAMAEAADAEARALRQLADALATVQFPSRQEEFVSARDAPRFGLTPRQFREAIARGELPACEPGRRWVARASDVAAYVQKHPVSPKARARAAQAHDSVDGKIRALLDAGRLRVIGPR